MCFCCLKPFPSISNQPSSTTPAFPDLGDRHLSTLQTVCSPNSSTRHTFFCTKNAGFWGEPFGLGPPVDRSKVKPWKYGWHGTYQEAIPKGNDRHSTIHFLGAKILVSGRVSGSLRLGTSNKLAYNLQFPPFRTRVSQDGSPSFSPWFSRFKLPAPLSLHQSSEWKVASNGKSPQVWLRELGQTFAKNEKVEKATIA